MISRSIYFNILLRVLLILFLSLAVGYILAFEHSLRVSVLCFLLITILTYNLIMFLNRTNRNIRFFFDSVKNDDSSISFPENTGNKNLDELYSSMNNVNRQIQELKIANRQQEQYFQKILEHVAPGVLTYDERGFVLHANSSVKKLLSMQVLSHLKQIESVNSKLYEIINNLKPYERRLASVQTGQGKVQLSLKSTCYGQDENMVTILSIQDIRNELEEKELESWMKLIRVLMHEIMNSITPITSLSENISGIYIRSDKPINPESVTPDIINRTIQGLNVIKNQGKGLLSFVESYRKLIRIPKPEKRPVRITDLFNHVATLAREMDEKSRCYISFTDPDPGLEFFADDKLISQVLINLIKNAIEANENNPDARIIVKAYEGIDKKMEICVTDNGPGIKSDELEQIFVPFYTTREEGSGIGLSISRQIMSVHGGTLNVKSEPWVATEFCMCF